MIALDRFILTSLIPGSDNEAAGIPIKCPAHDGPFECREERQKNGTGIFRDWRGPGIKEPGQGKGRFSLYSGTSSLCSCLRNTAIGQLLNVRIVRPRHGRNRVRSSR